MHIVLVSYMFADFVTSIGVVLIKITSVSFDTTAFGYSTYSGLTAKTVVFTEHRVVTCVFVTLTD